MYILTGLTIHHTKCDPISNETTINNASQNETIPKILTNNKAMVATDIGSIVTDSSLNDANFNQNIVNISTEIDDNSNKQHQHQHQDCKCTKNASNQNDKKVTYNLHKILLSLINVMRIMQ